MPDADVLKTIINGGSFGVLVIILVWIMFKLEPRMSAMMTAKDAQHAATVGKIVEENRLATDALVAKFMEMVQKSHDDCREERKERDELLAKEMKLNREARHDAANKMKEVVAEMYDRYTPRQPNPTPNPNQR